MGHFGSLWLIMCLSKTTDFEGQASNIRGSVNVYKKSETKIR